ncbi:unnamed protein product [Rotaria socialis]|uniref:TTF-type domain-containing protein n=5 Tax=Rotaria socialis TaxID=392032 RepID=A0A818FA60_9BILA|nr:unnamed protein product [Rotaria socialis]
MEPFLKEPKHGTIQSFFRSHTKKNRKSNNSLTSIEITVSQSDGIVQIDSTSCTNQQEQLPLYSSTPRLLSPSSSTQQEQSKRRLEQISSSSPKSPRLLSPSSKWCSSSSTQQEQISSSSLESPQLLSPSSKRRQEQISSSLPKSPELLLSSSSEHQQEKVVSSLLESPLSLFSSSNKPIPNTVDISCSCNEPPSQPKLAIYPLSKHNRSFRSQWFSQFRWLEYSIQADAAYCYYCRHFNTRTNFNNRNQSDAFVRGFNSWKHACSTNQGFLKHQYSKSHIQAHVNFEEYISRKNSASSILQVIDRSRTEIIKQNRQKLAKIVSALHLCCRQMIAIRGHLESESSANRGNFIELLNWTSGTDPIASSILNDSAKNSTYLSPYIQNELISLLALHIRQQISEKERSLNYARRCVFSLMVDESRDVSGHEQLSVVLRVVDIEIKTSDENQLTSLFKEYFLGFVKLDEFDAQTLTDEIVKFLSSLNIDLNYCIAMCFDGASVLSGKHAGVQALLRQQHIPNAIYVHCYAHKLNLVICNVTKSVPYLSEFYSIISKIYTYFHTSSVTNETFKKIQQQLKIALNQSLEELVDKGTERSIDARGLLLALKEPLFVVTIFILHRLLGKIKILSDQLKSKSIDFGKAHTLISAVINQINELRSEEEFSRLFGQITAFCVENNIDLDVKVKQRRQRTISTRFKNCSVTSTIGQREEIDNDSKYRDFIFYPVIDSILVEMNDRFSKSNMEILRGISSLSPDSSTFLEVKELTDLCTMLQCDIVSLSNEAEVLKPMLKQSKSKDIVDLYFEVLPLQQAFPTIIHLLIGAMTIPVSSTTTERTFSKMKLIKTSARNTMSDDRLSDLSLLAIERDFVVDNEKIIDAFAIQHKNSRILLK